MAQQHVAGGGRLARILARLEPSLGSLAGEPVPLSGGITHHNFRVTLGGVDYVVRAHGKDTELLGIDREGERAASERAAGLAIAPPVAAALEDCLVTRFVPNDPVGPREVADGVREMAHALRSFHDCGARLPSRFWVPDLLVAYAAEVRERGGALPDAYAGAGALVARIAAVLPLGRPRPCHNDLLTSNIIRARGGGGLMIVDWEYAGMGHPCFDLGNLSVNNDFDEDADERLLVAYHGAAPSDGQRAALKLMRLLSDAREGAWGVVQGYVSDVELDFELYAREHFERMREAAERGQFEEWLAAAGAGGEEERGAQTA
jgi:thiamine kinase-like enzyme